VNPNVNEQLSIDFESQINSYDFSFKVTSQILIGQTNMKCNTQKVSLNFKRILFYDN